MNKNKPFHYSARNHLSAVSLSLSLLSQLVIIFVVIIGGGGCNPSQFSTLPPAPGPEPKITPPPLPVVTSLPQLSTVVPPLPVASGLASNAPTQVVLRTIKPVLAVRGMGCLMCHAQIQSNVITDFGAGDDVVFMGGPQPVNNHRFFTDVSGDNVHSRWYTNLYNSWQTATIKGSVYVPNVNVPLNTLSSLQPVTTPGGTQIPSPLWPAPYPATGIPLAALLTTPYVRPSDAWPLNNGTVPFNQPVSFGVTPPQATIAAINSLSQVTIRAPLASEILSIATQPLQSSGFQAFDGRTAGLNWKTNYITASSLTCYGDVVINGPLFLNTLSVTTDNQGCRLYVTGSVFIQGLITFNGDETLYPKQNLQISSSRAIVMGVGTSELQNRLVTDNRGMWTRNGNWSDRAAEILADQAAIGRVIIDATDPGNPVVDPKLNFSHLLLNAPIVESRYLGQLQGVLIAELAQFRLGQFNFIFDPVFGDTPILPLLPTDILVAQ